MKRAAVSFIGLGVLLGLLLAACSTDNSQNETCRAMARGMSCGPVPPAQTHFSRLVILTMPVGDS